MLKHTLTIFLFSALILFAHGAGDDGDDEQSESEVEHDEGNIRTHIRGRSGQVSIKFKDDSNNVTEVTIGLLSIFELDANGTRIGDNENNNNDKHSRDNFAHIRFSIGALVNDSFGGVQATKVAFSADMVGDSQLLIEVYVFTESGVVSESHLGSSETYNVQAGSTKINFAVLDWPFCDGGDEESDEEDKALVSPMTKKLDHHDCGEDNASPGEFLEFHLFVKSKNQAKQDDEDARVFDLDGAKLVLAHEVRIDGVYQPLPEGFPDVKFQGNRNIIKIRVPRFTSEAYYDPVVSLIDESDSDTTSPAPAIFSWLWIIALIPAFRGFF